MNALMATCKTVISFPVACVCRMLYSSNFQQCYNNFHSMHISSQQGLHQPKTCLMECSKQFATKIYTKTGDKGTSSLFTGERRPKYDPVFEALGDIDELSCNIGLCREILSESWQHDNFEELTSMLEKVQCCLQDVASCVATPLSSASEKKIERTDFEESLVTELEEWIDKFAEDLPELKNFILPSGGKSSCSLHVCRSVCRRAERRISVLLGSNDVNTVAAKYVNRLSDFLFTLARYVVSLEGQPEVIYKKPKRAVENSKAADKSSNIPNKDDE